MPTSPLSLQPLSGAPYGVLAAHLFMPQKGVWILDVQISPTDLALFGMPGGRCVVMFGGVPMSGTIDPASSGMFGPVGKARVVGGGNGWSKTPPAEDWHLDSGVPSTLVYESTSALLGETVVDLEPTTLGVDFVRAGLSPTSGPLAPDPGIPASAVFGDRNWFVDPTGTTFVGPRPPAVPDPSFFIRDFDPIHQKLTFSCDTLLLPGTPLVDPRLGANVFTVWNVEQIFDSKGSTGWAWSSSSPTSLVVDELKAAALYWTRAPFLRVYRYRLIVYQGPGPAGGPSRMALQAVTPTAGIPDLLPLAPWSGVAGVVSELAPSQEVLVVFENADPSLPRVVGYSLVATEAAPLGLPLTTTIDALTSIAVGTVCAVNIAGGLDRLVLATPYAALLAALTAFAGTAASATTAAQIATAASTLQTALGALPPASTTLTKAT